MKSKYYICCQNISIAENLILERKGQAINSLFFTHITERKAKSWFHLSCLQNALVMEIIFVRRRLRNTKKKLLANVFFFFVN